MRKAFDGIRKIPHPEEAAEQLSRRTRGADPANLAFLAQHRWETAPILSLDSACAGMTEGGATNGSADWL